jgi:hypothetical protein
VNAGGTVNVTYSSAPTLTTTPTGQTPASSYPFTDPIFQNYQVQQYLFVGGAVNPNTTDA